MMNIVAIIMCSIGVLLASIGNTIAVGLTILIVINSICIIAQKKMGRL